MLRSPAPPIINGGGPFPYSMCLTCPPYPHQHFEHFDHYQIHQNAHNHHLSQGSLHQQQHHLNAPLGGGNSSGPPSVESGGTASTGSTGGGVVTAITTLGRSGKQHHQHSHNHHHHHHHHQNGSHHHTKSHRSSSTGSSGSRHLQENALLSSALFFEPNFGSLTKTNTIGRTKRSVQPPGSLPVPKQTLSQLKKDSHNVLASLLPGMSFTLPAQSRQTHQHPHHQHHHQQHHQQQQQHHNPHHRQFLLQQQQAALASLSNSSSGALSLPSASSVATTVTNNPIFATSTLNSTAANGLKSSGGSGANGPSTVVASSTTLDKHSSLVSTSNGGLALVITTSTSSPAQQKTSASSLGQLSSSMAPNVKGSNHGIGHHRERNADDDSPPPLPPKSPRITSKPARPHDFPQQLQLSVVDPSIESAAKTGGGGGGNGSNMVPPPPPRRQSQKDSQAKYLRLLQEQSANKLPHSVIDPGQSMTLPSPILPPTPPPDVVMESPMSDSGPIISPPPAFSTPVTPMIDRQNSTTSDKSGGGGKIVSTGASTAATNSINNNHSNGTGRLRSLSQSTSHYHNITGFSLANTTVPVSTMNGGPPVNSNAPTSKPPHSHSQQKSQQQQQQQQHNHYHVPLSGTVSMSAISSVSGKTGKPRNNKSIPDLSSGDTTLRYSPMSRSRSNSSPMSPEESIPASSPDDDDDPDEDPTSSSLADNGHDGDDDCSEKAQTSSMSPKILAQGIMARRNSAKFLSHYAQPQPQHPQQSATLPKKVTLIPKSVTENFLYKVGSNGAGNVIVENDTIKTSSIAAQTDGKQQPRPRNTPEAPSPARRPILRSKSDLSHRYAKVEKSGASGFTLVHVDLGLPPPLPMHNSVSTNDFSINATTSTTTSGMLGGGNHKTSHHHHHQQQQHHIYQVPTNVTSRTLPSASSAHAHASHYHEPHNNLHLSEGKRATKSAGDLEKFFDMLGLDNTPAPAVPPSCPLNEIKDGASKAKAGGGSESPVFFSSVSSVDSAPRRSGSADSEDSPLDDKHGSRTVGYGKFGVVGGPTITVQHGEPSIVERNARVIKWLFNCRKALERR